MAPVETAYYELLDIAPDAKANELTSAYRKMCLKLHPDKGGSEEQFKAMKAAYDVLKDPQKRKMYDSHGEAIVRAMDGEVLEPEVMLKVVMHFTKTASRMVLCALPVIAVALLLPAVALSLRWDQRIAMNWMIVFAPMLIVHLIVLMLVLRLRTDPMVSAAADNEACEDESEQADAEERKSKVKRVLSITACMVVLIMAQEAVMAAKLQGDTQASWFLVLIPYLTFEFCVLYMRMRLLAIVEPMGPSLPFVAKAIMFAPILWWSVLRLSTVALIASKADGHIVCSWTVCLIPMMVGAGCQLLWSCRSKSIRSVDDEEPGQETSRAPGFFAACFAIAIWMSMLLLGAGKLDGQEYSALLVFLPFFLVVAQLLCCCTCLACCGPAVIDAFLREEQAKAGQQPHESEAQTLTPGLSSGIPSADYSTLP